MITLRTIFSAAKAKTTELTYWFASKPLVGDSTFWVFIFFFALTTLLYVEILNDLPRADHLVFISNFREGGISFEDLKRTVFFEFFGSDKRFQPLAFPLVYLQWKLFGTHFSLYHLTTNAIHALNATLLFLLINHFARNKLFSFLVALLFLTAATHIDIIAWTVHVYVLLQVTFILMSILCLLKWRSSSRPAFLYLAYTLVFLQMFFTEAGVIFPLLIFIASFLLWQSATDGREQIRKSLIPLVAAYGVFLLAFLAFSILDPRAMPSQLLSGDNILRSLWGTVIHFGSTAFLHNVLYSAQVIIDDMLYFVPNTWSSLSPTGGTAYGLIFINTLALAALVALFILSKKPGAGQRIPVLLIIIGGVAFSFMLILVRPTSYAISQSRYAYIPTLTLAALLPVLLAHHFSSGSKRATEEIRAGGVLAKVVIVAALTCLIFINMGKTLDSVGEVAGYRAYTNDIYYAARNFISQPVNQDARLFISVPSYPSHERLAWGTDLIPDLFLTDSHITKNLSEATHIMLPGPVIQEISARKLPYIEFTSYGGEGDFAQDLSSEVSQLAGRTLTLTVNVKTGNPDAISPFIWSDSGGYVLGEAHQGTDQFATISVTSLIPNDARALWAGLRFTQRAAAWVSRADLYETSACTNNILLNTDFQHWSQGPGPFTGNNMMWADGWMTDMRGDSTIVISGDLIDEGAVNMALVEYTHAEESYLVYQVPNPSSLLGHNVVFSMKLKTDTKKAVRLGITWDAESGLWSDLHPGDGNWHTLTLSGPLPDTSVRTLSLLVVLDKSATVYLSSPSLSGSPARGGNLLANAAFDLWEQGLGPFASSTGTTLTANGWYERLEDKASIVTKAISTAPPVPTIDPDDFNITFGLMPIRWPGEPLEVFGFTSATADQPQGWFLRLLYGVGEDSPQAGFARLELGYREGTKETIVFCSRSLPTRQGEMNHYVLGRDNGTFYLIFNGELVEKVRDNTLVSFSNMKLDLGEVHSFVYPYYQHPVPYFAYTHIQIGKSEYSAEDKPLGYRFNEISFNRFGFMPYHFSLGW
jgi:hypothetical protein